MTGFGIHHLEQSNMMPAQHSQSRWAQSSLDEYFREISRTPLLSAAEESEWGRAPSEEEVGNYLNLTKAKRRIIKQALSAHCVASQPGAAEDGWGLEETIVDQRPSVDSEGDDAEDWQRVQHLLGRLKQRE